MPSSPAVSFPHPLSPLPPPPQPPSSNSSKVNYVVCMLLSIVLGYFFRLVPTSLVTLRHLISIGLGLAFCVFCFRFGTIYALLQATICYILILADRSGRYVHWFVCGLRLCASSSLVPAVSPLLPSSPHPLPSPPSPPPSRFPKAGVCGVHAAAAGLPRVPQLHPHGRVQA